MDPRISAEENIKKLAFMEGGILFTEFEKIFSDLFAPRNELFKKIVGLLASGSKTQAEIASLLGYKTQSEIGEYLNDLEKSGFVGRDFTWNINTGTESNLSLYRLSDNYSRFYLKYILPNKNKILRGSFKDLALTSLPAWTTIMGLQIENLILNNQNKILSILNIPPNEVEITGSFFQRKSQRHPGCQIDYLIQTLAKTLYVCEVKFSRNVIGTPIIAEMQNKIQNLKTPKQFFCRPVLIHVNGVSDDVYDSNYFCRIINMSELFE